MPRRLVEEEGGERGGGGREGGGGGREGGGGGRRGGGNVGPTSIVINVYIKRAIMPRFRLATGVKQRSNSQPKGRRRRRRRMRREREREREREGGEREREGRRGRERMVREMIKAPFGGNDPPRGRDRTCGPGLAQKRGGGEKLAFLIIIGRAPAKWGYFSRHRRHKAPPLLATN